MNEYSNVIYSRIKIYPDSIEGEILKLVDECSSTHFDGLETNRVIDTFYQGVNPLEIDNEWLMSNIGSETITLSREDEIVTTETNHFVPDRFLIELYKIATYYNPDASIYCKYYDEHFNLVGGIIIKDGLFCEKNECLSLQMPDDEDPNYNLFIERLWKIVIDSQDDYIDYCEKSIDEYIKNNDNIKYNDSKIEVIAKKMWVFVDDEEEDVYC
jgi:hypothetical protein